MASNIKHDIRGEHGRHTGLIKLNPTQPGCDETPDNPPVSVPQGRDCQCETPLQTGKAPFNFQIQFE